MLHCLQPLPVTSSSSLQGYRETSDNRSQPYKTGKGKSKSVEKGKGKGKSTMPQEMVNMGCRATTNSGQPICYSYSLGSCKSKPVKGRCDRGFHVCAIPGCGAHHAAKDCPKKAQPHLDHLKTEDRAAQRGP